MIRVTEQSSCTNAYNRVSTFTANQPHHAVVVRLFDQSSTMGAASAEEMADIAGQCEKALAATGKRVRLIDIVFDSHVRVLLRPRFAQANPNNLDLRMGGGTNIREALETAVSEFLVARPANSVVAHTPLEVLLLVSDGKYNAKARPDAALQALKSSGVQIVAIAAGSDANLERLQGLASSPAHVYTPQISGISNLLRALHVYATA